MKILADANVERAIVLWLRSQLHDVLWAAEDLAPGTPDLEVLYAAAATFANPPLSLILWM